MSRPIDIRRAARSASPSPLGFADTDADVIADAARKQIVLLIENFVLSSGFRLGPAQRDIHALHLGRDPVGCMHDLPDGAEIEGTQALEVAQRRIHGFFLCSRLM
jgi:hypothetical protein